jgi:hypothetical protein
MGTDRGPFPYKFTPLGQDGHRLDRVPHATAFNDMELYLMGLAPPESVGPHQVVIDPEQKLCDGCLVHGPMTTVTAQDVIAAHGPRIPAYPDSPNRFTMATIVVSLDRPLTPREMAFFDYFAARGEATTPLPVYQQGTRLPFAVTTGGRATLVTALGPRRQ